MTRLLVLMISIGLADSINPSTIAPALYLASTEHARSSVARFTFGVFVTYLAGGFLFALGPGQLVRDAISDVRVAHDIRYAAEILAGVLLLVAAGYTWRRRNRMVAKGMPGSSPKRRSAALLGATITAVELPTAFPYFAAITAVVGSGLGLVRELVLITVFNVAFILPLLAIEAVLFIPGDRAQQVLQRWRAFLQRRWPHILVGLLTLVGLIALFFGITGLASGIHGGVGRFFRRVRNATHIKT